MTKPAVSTKSSTIIDESANSEPVIATQDDGENLRATWIGSWASSFLSEPYLESVLDCRVVVKGFSADSMSWSCSNSDSIFGHTEGAIWDS
jgi:hypothetical protein